MSIEVKICGLSTAAAVSAAVEGGADLVGFVFFPPSPRAIAPVAAAELVHAVPARVGRVGLFVDAGDDLIAGTLAAVSLDMLQLHGGESPARVAEVRRRFGLPVIKALPVATSDDLDRADRYVEVADRLLFDARPPAGANRPGGNACPFDWRLLHGRRIRRPWFLAGGLSADNVAAAVRESGAAAVDVSSGVEDGPGVKSPEKIRIFLARTARL
jgi:phosphoribosylanthranilate isomerase